MPVWHEATRKLQDEGKLQLVGIIQEQHPDRCRLFMQWKEMKWPILVDSLNLLGVKAVPISLLIDEYGVVRGRVRNPVASREKIAAFLRTVHEKPAGLPAPGKPQDAEEVTGLVREGAASAGRHGSWTAYGDALFLRGKGHDITRSIEAYRKATRLGAGPEADFRLGVALRRRYESPDRRPGDLQATFTAWDRALSERPNQYIWRRRIQQYGPRLEKPYAFYDWVEEARKEIRKRGASPHPLRVEPGGAEIAYPQKSFAAAREAGKGPDPLGRIQRDRIRLVRAELGVVPATVRRGGTTRVHVVFRPDAKRKAHWNNEAGKLQVWIDTPDGIEVDRRRLTAPNARKTTSSEVREVEFEVKVSKELKPGKLTIPAYALYYVCEDVDGVCKYLRQDIEVGIDVR